MARHRFLCRIGFHDMRSWSLPEEIQRGLLSDRWSWSARKCIHCDLAITRLVQVKRIDGNTGSLRG